MFLRLDKLENGDDIQDYLYSITGQTSVPNIFVRGHHLGGFTDLAVAIKNGRLQDMLQAQTP